MTPKSMIWWCVFLTIACASYSQDISKINNDKRNTGLAIKKLTEAIVDRDCKSIFFGHCYVGPLLWKKYKSLPNIKKIKDGDITFKVKLNKGTKLETIKLLPGKFIQNKNDFQVIWLTICQDLSNSNVSIRSLSKNERDYYWGITFFDISDPLYIMENKSIKLLINQYPDSYKILWLDEVSKIEL